MGIKHALKVIAAIKATPAWQRQMESKLARQMGSLFDEAAAAVLRELTRRGVPTGTIDIATMIKPIVDAEEQLLDFAADGAVEAAEHAQRSVVDRLRKQGVPTEAPRLLDVVRERIKQKVFEASGQTMARVRGDIMGTLAKAYEDGVGTLDAAARLGEVFTSMRDYELARVARTEIHGAQSDQTERTMRDLGVEYEQWITAIDGRERDSHALVHEEISRVGAQFSNGLLYPGDRNAPIEEWINCRCRGIPYIMPPGAIAPPGKDAFMESEIIRK